MNINQLFRPFQTITRYDEPMSKHTYFRIGGPAEVFITPETNTQVLDIYRLCHEHQLPFYILGNGSNLLVRDEGLKGVVIKINSQELQIKDDTITVGAGFSLAQLVSRTMESGLTGLELLAGIPGSVGGAIAMNAGGEYGNMGDVIQNVEAIKLLTYKDNSPDIQIIKRKQLRFGYRNSNLKNKFIILSAQLQLETSTQAQVKAMFQEIMSEKHNAQPLADKSAGCVFKNPPGHLTTGQMIEKAGLKGTKIGGAMVSTKHSNFIVNTNNATAADVLKLIELIKEKIDKQFEVELELEIEIWGD